MPRTDFDEVGVSAGYLFNAVVKERVPLPTIATTGTVGATFICKYAGTLAAALLVAKDALTANDTNYVTVAITNRTSGGGSTAMLAATDANTSKATGGVAIAAFTKRTLTLNGTPANLVVSAGDTLEVTVAATGTLANAVSEPSLLLTFTPSSNPGRADLPGAMTEATVLLPRLAGRTTAQSSGILVNSGGQNLVVYLITWGIGSASLTVSILDIAPGDLVATTLLASAAITTNTTTRLRVSPHLTAAANSIAKEIVPALFQINVAVADASAAEYSLSYSLS
jgi:hypothetical protein